MESDALLPGIGSEAVQTDRLRVHTLTAGSRSGMPVVLLHGNVSSARFWEETMLELSGAYRFIAPDLRGYGDTEAVPVDATGGLRDWSDDLDAFAVALDLSKFHLVSWSLGAGVAMQYAIEHPERLLSLTFMSPLSPYGFGGTRDAQGNPTYDDFAASGGGTANPEFVQRLSDKDRSDDSPFSPRNVMNAFYFKPPFRVSPEREEAFVSSMLSTRIGEGFYPGDLTPSSNWPGVAPGTQGFNNAVSPKYCDLSSFSSIDPKPPVLWVRGKDDQIVSDTSLFDFGFLGQIGAVPGWPGEETHPPQPMVSQMRALLDAYHESGGRYWEKALPDCGHSPHIEKAQEFNQMLLAHLGYAENR